MSENNVLNSQRFILLRDHAGESIGQIFLSTENTVILWYKQKYFLLSLDINETFRYSGTTLLMSET